MHPKNTIGKTCEHCEASFRVSPSQINRKFCSPACYRGSRRREVIDNGDGTASVPLTRGAVAIIDVVDIERVAKHSWCLDRAGNRLDYAMTRINNRSVRLHRYISSPPDGLHVDHVNGNGLDNRRENLRLCSHRENLRNQRPQEGTVSGFKGVTVNKGSRRWRAKIVIDDREVLIGTFNDAESAARAYDAAALEMHGEFAHLNFPD